MSKVIRKLVPWMKMKNKLAVSVVVRPVAAVPLQLATKIHPTQDPQLNPPLIHQRNRLHNKIIPHFHKAPVSRIRMCQFTNPKMSIKNGNLLEIKECSMDILRPSKMKSRETRKRKKNLD